MVIAILVLTITLVYWGNNVITTGITTSKSKFYVKYLSLLAITAFCIALIAFREIGYENAEIYGGVDSINYVKFFYIANINYIDSLLLQAAEPGYGSLVWLFSTYVGDYSVFQIAIYIFIFYSYYRFTKELPRSVLSIITYFLLAFMIIDSFNILRQIIAVFISLFVYLYLERGNYRYAIFASLCGITFHVSAVVLLLIVLMYWLHQRFFHITTLCTIYVVMLLVSSLSAYMVIPYIIDGTGYSEYAERGVGEFSLNTFLSAGIVIALGFNRYRRIVDYCKFNRVLLLSLPSICFVLPIFYSYSMGYRFLLFYLPLIYALLPSLFYSYRLTLGRNFVYAPLFFALVFYVLARVFRFVTVESDYAGLYRFGLTLSP